MRAKAKAWDKVGVPPITGGLPLPKIILAGMDWRFGWTRLLSLARVLAGFVLVLGGIALTGRAMKTT